MLKWIRRFRKAWFLAKHAHVLYDVVYPQRAILNNIKVGTYDCPLIVEPGCRVVVYWVKHAE